LIETACSFCEEKWTFADQAFHFSEENFSSIENEWKVSKQNTHSIEDADKLVETRCTVVDEEWSPVEATRSSSSTKWNSISIDCSLAPIDCSFASIVCQVSSIASSFVHEEATPREGNAPSRDESDSSFASKRQPRLEQGEIRHEHYQQADQYASFDRRPQAAHDGGCAHQCRAGHREGADL
jgi:hypothetical protein